MKWIERLQWMALGAMILSMVMALISMVMALTTINHNSYQRETRQFANKIIKLEAESEHIQNMSFKDDLCFQAYTKQLQLLTRDYIKRMGAQRILDK